MKKTVIIAAIVAVLAIIILIVIGKVTSKKDVGNLYVEAQRGQFDIVVTTTGELEAENSTDITGPQFAQNRRMRAMDIQITDLVPEGTEVKEGDYIATLDRTNFDNNLKDALEQLETLVENMEVKSLDTAVTLSNLRDNIKNLQFNVEEAEITLEQSQFEPPTTIRQAEISLDKAKRSLEQARKSYALRVEQEKSDIRRQELRIREQRETVADIQKVLSQFVITAPSDGMVIYKRDRTGTKRKVGSSISPWDNVVATLPDMSTMISKTYVNEIDVSKVKPEQKVEMAVDAFPDKAYAGSVISVANIGEQLPNTDAKVFEVLIKVDGSDPILRPSMTTGNKIITKSIDDVTYIALECVHATADSVPFVYTKNGYRQIVLLGESNEDNVVIEDGLEPGETVYLNTPEDPDNFKLSGEDLIEINKERAKAKRDEEQRIRDEAERAISKRPGMEGMTPEMMERFENMTPEMMERFQNMRQQGGARDTGARRMMNVQRPRQGTTGDTAARRRPDTRTGEQTSNQDPGSAA